MCIGVFCYQQRILCLLLFLFVEWVINKDTCSRRKGGGSPQYIVAFLFGPLNQGSRDMETKEKLIIPQSLPPFFSNQQRKSPSWTVIVVPKVLNTCYVIGQSKNYENLCKYYIVIGGVLRDKLMEVRYSICRLKSLVKIFTTNQNSM